MIDQLSISEIMAERVYDLLREGRMGRHTFIHNFKCLAKRKDNIGVYYLTWLLARSNNKYINKLLIQAIDSLCA